MLAQGKISFRTCTYHARIPIGYLTALAKVTYSSEVEPHTLKDAIHHWLLVETLGAIGGHSMA
jgi:hypothetical protein